jgi:hypothetical protein
MPSINALPSPTQSHWIKIVSPVANDVIPFENVTVVGTSSDNESISCEVYVDLNDQKPFKKVNAIGSDHKNDYSKWNYIFNAQLEKFVNGTNNITSKLVCDSLSQNVTKWYSINVNVNNFNNLNNSLIKNKSGNESITYDNIHEKSFLNTYPVPFVFNEHNSPISSLNSKPLVTSMNSQYFKHVKDFNNVNDADTLSIDQRANAQSLNKPDIQYSIRSNEPLVETSIDQLLEKKNSIAGIPEDFLDKDIANGKDNQDEKIVWSNELNNEQIEKIGDDIKTIAKNNSSNIIHPDYNNDDIWSWVIPIDLTP